MATAFQEDTFQTGIAALLQESAPGNTFAVAGGTDTSQAERAQSFLALDTFVAYVDILLFKANSPTDNLFIEIQTDASNKPSGTVVGSTISIPSASLLISPGDWQTFAVAATVTVGVKYWIVLRRDVGGAGDSLNAPKFNSDPANPYASGGQNNRNGSTGVWSVESSTNDIAFRVVGLKAFQIDAAAAADMLDPMGMSGFFGGHHRPFRPCRHLHRPTTREVMDVAASRMVA